MENRCRSSHGLFSESFLGAIRYASENSTSLNAVNESLGSGLKVLLEACHGVADKFALSDDVVTALADFKRCERERHELQKKADLDSAEAKREAGLQLLSMIGKKTLVYVSFCSIKAPCQISVKCNQKPIRVEMCNGHLHAAKQASEYSIC